MGRKLAPWHRWFFGQDEYVAELGYEQDDLVLRARPDVRFVTVFEVPWRVELRRRSKDPFGKPIWIERLPDRQAAMVCAAELTRKVRRGDLPWESSP